MSSSDTTPYIGSKISLISKAQIRYEGTLYAIDTNESTVHLSDVKSFGTEHRDRNRPIPPQNQIYPYVVFNGAEIEDLQVCEPPRSTAVEANAPYTDPAIVSSSKTTREPGPVGPPPMMPPAPPSNYNSFGMYSGISTMMQGPGYIPEPSRNITTSVQPVQSTFSPINIPSTAVVTPSVSTLPPPTTKPDNKNSSKTPNAIANSTAQDANVGKRSEEPTTGSNKSSKANEESKQLEPSQNAIENKAKEPEEEKTREEEDKGEDSKKFIKTNRSNQHQNYNRRPFSGRRPRGNYYNNYNRSRQGPSNNKPLKFDEDFDFEKANAPFAKERLEQELSEKLNEELSITDGNESTVSASSANNQKFYNKSNSFFDNISCDSATKKPSWKNSNKNVNMETFGVSSVNSGRYHRGGARGRGRGGYVRGRGNNYNNRGRYQYRRSNNNYNSNNNPKNINNKKNDKES